MGHPLPGLLAPLAPLLDRYGYAAVAVLVLADRAERTDGT